MATVTAIRKADGGDQRAALKRAVADAQKARTAVERHRDAITRAEKLVQEAQAKFAVAGVAVGDARQEHARHIAAVISGGGLPSSTGAIRSARAHKRDAEDDLAASKDALNSLQADLGNLESDEHVAARVVDAALSTTVRPVALRLLEETRACHLQFLVMREALSTLSRSLDSLNDDAELVKQIARAGSPATMTCERWPPAGRNGNPL
jgi:hypothetical protein